MQVYAAFYADDQLTSLGRAQSLVQCLLMRQHMLSICFLLAGFKDIS